MLNYLPKYISLRAIAVYIVGLAVVSVIFMSRVMAWYWFIFGLVSVLCFFHFSNVLTKKWANTSERILLIKLFLTALVVRIIWVIFSDWFYIYMTGLPFEYGAQDSLFYDAIARDLATRGFAHYESVMQGLSPSDRGYPTYLGIVYMLSGKSILVARLIKALISAFTCVLIYKLAKRNFGGSIGCIAGIFSMLMPNLIYYCGLHLKETEMVFLTVAFVERADYVLRSKKYNLFNIIIPALLASSMFFFRTVLGAVAIGALGGTIVFSDSKQVGWGRRIMLGICLIAVIGYFLGNRVTIEVQTVWEASGESQQRSLEYRTERQGGNKFAKYAGTAVFAPMIFIMPYPTMINIEDQENQQLMNGSNFVKNITAFFTMLGVFVLFYRKKWKKHMLILSFLIGYLAVIALSPFAHSDRFHMPCLPFALIIAAYGLSQMDNKKKIYYNVYLVIIFIAIIVWNWFKLAGRGLY